MQTGIGAARARYVVGELGPERYLPEDGGPPRTVGRQGPELFAPPQDGVIIPNQGGGPREQAYAGGGVTIPNHLVDLGLRLKLTLEQVLALMREGVQGRAEGGAVEGAEGVEAVNPEDQEKRKAALELVRSILGGATSMAGGGKPGRTGDPLYDGGSGQGGDGLVRDSHGNTTTRDILSQAYQTNPDSIPEPMRSEYQGGSPQVGGMMEEGGYQRPPARTGLGAAMGGQGQQGQTAQGQTWGFQQAQGQGRTARPFQIPQGLMRQGG